MAQEQSEPSIKSKKPSDSAFKQQRLPAWQPILTAGTVLPTFFVIGIAFIPVGIGLLYFSDEVKEISIDYTNCTSYVVNTAVDNPSQCSSTDFTDTLIPCAQIIANNSNANCTCRLEFKLETDFVGKVYMYYGLSNYYQNHRRYVKSRDDSQLLGHLSKQPSTDCVPFAYTGTGDNSSTTSGTGTATATATGTGLPVAPCGAIANSLFSDVLSICNKQLKAPVPLIRTGIAWPSDKQIKFRNPEGNLKDAFKDFAKPTSWRKPVYELDTEDPANNAFQNEDLIVWMRTAALPTFRKLYRRVNHSASGYSDGLRSGEYVLYVNYSYSVSAFDGTKRMILSTTSLLGGKNPFLGIAYIVVGCVCLLLGIALLFIHIKCSRSTSEMINVNPRTPYQ